MKGILTTVLLLLIWELPIIIKAVRESKSPKPSVKTPMPEDFLDEEDNMDLQQNRSNVPNEQEYFTYERMDSEDGLSSVYAQSEVDSKAQTVVNEEENEYSLTLEEEEVYKGIVYSEILKKRYN